MGKSGGKGTREDTGGRLCCMRAKRASAMAQVAGTRGRGEGGGGWQEKGGKGRKAVSRERGTRGNESRAR